MNVPQLRFDGFDGEWEQQELSELLEFKNGINADKDSYGHGAKFINVLDILNNDYILSENIIGSVNATEQQLQTYSVTYGDILFLRSSETREDVGKCNVYLDEEKPAVFGGFVIRGKKIAEYSPFFLKTLLNNSSARDQISSKAGGSTRYNVGQSILSEVTMKVPGIAEQEKISSFLMLLNQRIEKQKEKIEKQEQFKKGMMQKIFSQKLRFKDEDGEEFEDWEEKSFSNLLESISTKPYQILASQITNAGKYEVVDQGKSSIAGYSDSSEKLFNTGPAIVYGDHTTVVKFREKPFVIGADGTKILINIRKEDSLKYLYFALSFYNLEPQGYKRHFSILKNIKLPVPQPKEQEKIANFLSRLEREIEKEKEKLMVLDEQKKGFMQGLLV